MSQPYQPGPEQRAAQQAPQGTPPQPMPPQPMPAQRLMPQMTAGLPMTGPPMSPVEQQMDMMRRQQLAESQAQTQYKSAGAAYVLWFFLGIVGGHRWYLRSPGVAIGQLCTLGGLGFWAFFDVFAIGGRLAKVNGDIRREVYLAHGIPVA